MIILHCGEEYSYDERRFFKDVQRMIGKKKKEKGGADSDRKEG